MIQRNLTFFLLGWIIIISYFIISMSSNSNSIFFTFGPNKQFIFFGIIIDTWKKYYMILFFSFVNSCIRKLNENLIQPWITLNVQNEDKIKKSNMAINCFLITNISNLYHWVDWIIYMNLLFSQIDIVILEIFAEMIILNLSTYYYVFNQDNKTITHLTNEDHYENIELLNAVPYEKL